MNGFLGPNGAGKSTTTRLLLGPLRADAGTIQLFGRSLRDHRRALLRRVDALIEAPSLYEHLTGRETLEVTRRMRGGNQDGGRPTVDRAEPYHRRTFCPKHLLVPVVPAAVGRKEEARSEWGTTLLRNACKSLGNLVSFQCLICRRNAKEARFRHPAMMHRYKIFLLQAVFLCVALLLFPSTAQGQSSAKVTVDYVLVVDVSGSMRGLPAGSGNADIFSDVQEGLSNFVGELEPGISIFVVPFADGVRAVKRFDIQSEADLEQVRSYVQNLAANGASTHVYQSVLDAFAAYGDFRQSQAGRGEGRRVGVLQVYTDGQDNGPENYAMSDVLGRFKNMRQKSDWLYYSTLGVELSDQARQAILASDVATYNPQPGGTVAPTRVVELGPPAVLDFGNLMSNPDASRSMRFTVRSRQGLPNDFRLKTAARFDSLEQQGAYAEVEPEQVDPTTPVTLTLNLFNEQSLSNGRYEGAINFVSPEPSVIIAPNAIEARFRYQPKRTVSVSAPRGQDELRAALTADPFRSDSSVSQGTATFPLRFNEEARQRGGAFRVRLEQDADAAGPLPPEAFRINGQPGMERTLQAGQVRDLTVGVRATDEVAPGRYEGTISVSSNAVEVDSAAASIPWRLEVAAPPRTAGQWAVLIGGLLLLALLLFVLAHRFLMGYWIWEVVGTPTLSGRLTVVEPASEGFREIALAGKHELHVGSGGDVVPDAQARVLLQPDRNGRSVHTKARLEEGDGAMCEPGETQYRSFASERLRDGYRLKVPPYELEYNNP